MDAREVKRVARLSRRLSTKVNVRTISRKVERKEVSLRKEISRELHEDFEAPPPLTAKNSSHEEMLGSKILQAMAADEMASVVSKQAELLQSSVPSYELANPRLALEADMPIMLAPLDGSLGWVGERTALESYQISGQPRVTPDETIESPHNAPRTWRTGTIADETNTFMYI